MSTLGSRIKSSREALSMQQSELEKLIGVKTGVVSNWERDINKPNADKLVLLCKALKIKLSYLLDYYGDESFTENICIENDEERKLITSFRLLSKEGKEYIAQTVELALNTYARKDEDQREMKSLELETS